MLHGIGRLFVVGLIVFWTSACVAVGGTGDVVAPHRLVIAGADIEPISGPRLTSRTVVIEGDRIVAIRPFQPRDLELSDPAIDARGMVLMPGLVDMHVHLPPVTGETGDPAQRTLSVMLAHGVTTARSMAGHANNLVVRDKVEAGTLPGPRLYLASPALHGGNTPTQQAAAARVQAAKEAGFDLVKSHQLSDPAIWQAARDEAERQDLPTAGHVANPVGLDRAMRAGQQIEHLDGFVHALLPEDIRRTAEDFGQIPPPDILAAVDRTGLPTNPILDLARATRSWHVPTLSLFAKLLSDRTVAEMREMPEMRFATDQQLDQWTEQRSALAQAFPSDYGPAFASLRRDIVQALAVHGVGLMAGSDTTQAFHVAGPALHQEIAALAEVIGNANALRAATIAPRDYLRSLPGFGSALGWPADFGTVEVGASADLLLLERDPVADLSALDRPRAVIARGRLFDRAALDAMLAAAAYR